MSTPLSRLPNGVKFVGGAVCLDFVNTVGAWVSAADRARQYQDVALRDKLSTYSDLLAWSRAASTVSAAELRHLAQHAGNHSNEAAEVLARATGLRSALYRIFRSIVEKWTPNKADLELLERELGATNKHERLRYASGVFTWSWDANPECLDRVLWPVVRSATALLTSPDLSQLRQCGGEECGWMFLDTSRNHQRRWCDMKDCGNRAKVRKFRELHAGGVGRHG